MSSANSAARRTIAETLCKERLTSGGLQLPWCEPPHQSWLGKALRRETTMELKWIAQELGIGNCARETARMSYEELKQSLPKRPKKPEGD